MRSNLPIQTQKLHYYHFCRCLYAYLCLTVQKLSQWEFLKEINTFIQQGYIKLLKSDSKYFYIVTKNIFQILFLKDLVTLATGVMVVENVTLPQRNKLHFKTAYFKIENNYF